MDVTRRTLLQVLPAAAAHLCLTRLVHADPVTVHFEPGVHSIVTDTTFDADTTVVIDDGAVLDVAAGITLTINGPLQAPRSHVFQGPGTVAGSPVIDASFPEWFGAVGAPDASQAFERAAALCRRVLGQAGLAYRIECTARQWHPFDLHRAGKVGELAAGTGYALGYWCGAMLPAGTLIEACTIELTGDGDFDKSPFAFAFGEPTSSPRHSGGGFKGCTIRLAPDAPRWAGPTPRSYKCFLGQSVDGFTFEQNLLEGDDPRAYDLVGGSLFDCTWPRILSNQANGVATLVIFEFCSDIAVHYNILWDCHHLLDADKRNLRLKATHNSFDRAAIDTDTAFADAVFEFNGINGLEMSRNVVRRARRYVLLGGKLDIYDTWDGVLAQSGPASFVGWRDVWLEKNTVSDTQHHALFVGNRWDKSPHPGWAAGKNLYVSDRFTNCGKGGTNVIEIQEGTYIRLYPNLVGGPKLGVMARSCLDAESPGATQFSDLDIAAFGGTISGCAGGGVSIEAARRVVFRGLVLTGNGASAATGLKQQLVLTKPGARHAAVSGWLTIDAGTAVLEKGLRIKPDVRTASAWNVALADSRLVGHTQDLFMDAPPAAAILSTLVKVERSVVGTTNIPAAVV